LSANRNKRSIAIDWVSEQGQDLIGRLIWKADVLAENHKRGGLDRYGLSYEQLRSKLPRLIYCSITGFGHAGPYFDRPGYDLASRGWAAS
jgi:crotonobetainyl-CoA:carnitine CoA-transferase CaiB-like acyl-CoA transferase